jgi:hypothetical protein
VVRVGIAESPAFRQVTFRHGTLGTARFTADGQNIVYTAAWEAYRQSFSSCRRTRRRPIVRVKERRLLAVLGTNNVVVALTPARLSVRS